MTPTYFFCAVFFLLDSLLPEWKSVVGSIEVQPDDYPSVGKNRPRIPRVYSFLFFDRAFLPNSVVGALNVVLVSCLPFAYLAPQLVN